MAAAKKSSTTKKKAPAKKAPAKKAPAKKADTRSATPRKGETATARPGGEDRVAMPSIRADGTPDQSPNFERLVKDDG